MKTRWIILIGFLFLLAQPFPCIAAMKAFSAETSPGKEGIGKQRADLVRTQRPNKFHKLKGGKKAGLPVTCLNGTPLKAIVSLVQGDAKAQIDGRGEWVALRAGDVIPPRSRLKTGRDSSLEIRYEDGSSLLFRSDTEVKVVAARKDRTCRLLRDFFLSAGRVSAKVRSATGQTPRFRIHTPSAIASVRGTEFRVAVDEKQKTFVEVLESKVIVDTAKKSISLKQGQGAMVNAASSTSPPRKLLAPPSPVELKPADTTPSAIAFTRVEGARAYRVMAATDREGKQLLRECVIKPDEIFPMAGLPDGAYYLLTQSIDSVGLEGPTSSAYPFTNRDNPLPPMILAFPDGTKVMGKEAIFEWLRVGDAVGYHVQISEDREFQTIVLDKTDLKALICKIDGLEFKTYYFRIRSMASDGYQGGWSDTLPFTVTPPDASSGKQAAVSPDEISLRSRNLGDGFTYHFQLARDNQFKEILSEQKADKPEVSFRKPKEAGVYFLRVAAIDRNGKAGEFSVPQSLEIKKRFPYKWAAIGGGAGLLLLLLLIP